mmetsp:Transcript_23529/g.80884  ORF Transcript_23529/g.80884 Transcript_23529/m.80884 type:complete len:157 (-) Transcript_23529:100-570(-)
MGDAAHQSRENSSPEIYFTLAGLRSPEAGYETRPECEREVLAPRRREAFLVRIGLVGLEIVEPRLNPRGPGTFAAQHDAGEIVDFELGPPTPSEIIKLFELLVECLLALVDAVGDLLLVHLSASSREAQSASGAARRVRRSAASRALRAAQRGGAP